jgi:signal transduction histidine kinase
VREECHAALARALAWCSAKADALLEAFACQAATELYHICKDEYASLALVVRSHGAGWLIGKPREIRTLPDEALQSCFFENSASVAGCRIRDHALDTVRFVDAEFRTSIVAPVLISPEMLPDAQAIVWFGLVGGATRSKIERANVIAESITEWFNLYGPILATLRERVRAVSEQQEQLRRMTSIAHDIRAPLAALKYMLTAMGVHDSEMVMDSRRVAEELCYVEQLLASCSPRARAEIHQLTATADVAGVLLRVADRFQVEVKARGGIMQRRLPYEPCGVRMPALALERVLSNIVGNAIRYTGAGVISLDLEDGHDRNVVARISDTGPGVPQKVLDQLLRGDTSSNPVAGAHGWGVGLLSCREILEEFGGRLQVTSSEHGTVVEIVLVRAAEENPNRRPDAEFCDSRQSTQYADSWNQVLIVDDDAGHSESLGRVLARHGIRVRAFGSVDEALKFVTEIGPDRVIVMCDAHMPGGGATRLLQAFPKPAVSPCIAVMSGEDNDESVYRFAALGAREFFAKPLNIELVLQWVRECRL